MKVLLYTCLGLAALLASPRLSAAQGLTNLNLENWVTRGGVERPVNWLTTDDNEAYYNQQPSGTYNLGLVTKTTDAHGGTYAAKLTTNNATAGTQTGAYPGVLILGAQLNRYNALGTNAGGAPLAAKPASMTFYYKSTVPAADSAIAIVYLSKNTNGVPTVLALGYQVLQPAASYTAATVPISYSTTNTATPDSVHIVFESAFADYVTLGSVLQVDDISFAGVTLATRADADVQDRLTVSPNPSAGGRFVIASPVQPELAAAPLEVLDLAGRAVLRQAAQSSPSGSRELDLSSLSAGLYLLRLDTRQGTVMRQLTVQ